MTVYISSRMEVPNFGGKGITNIVGIEDPNTPKLEALWISSQVQYNRILFYDTSTGPTVEHIRDLIRLYSHISPQNILFHCAYGANRSPAAAYIFLCAKGLQPVEAIKIVTAARPGWVGNATMIKLASNELRDKEIFKVWEERFAGKPKW